MSSRSVPTIPIVFATHPCIIFRTFLLSFSAIIVFYVYFSASLVPTFSDTDAGFATSQTQIYRQWEKLQVLRLRTSSNSQAGARFVDYPHQYRDTYLSNSQQITKLLKPAALAVKLEKRSVSTNQNVWADNNLYFCCQPGKNYPKIVFKSNVKDSNLFSGQSKSMPGTLFTLEGIQAMCRVTFNSIVDHQDFKTICDPIGRAYCCPVWSLGNYIALLRGRESCNHITYDDVNYVRQLLDDCRDFYVKNTLLPDCWSLNADYPNCQNIPEKCSKYNAVYEILHFVVDKKFAMLESSMEPLSIAISYVPVQKGPQLPKIYLHNFSQYTELDCNWWACVHVENRFDANVSLVACDFGLENVMFGTYLYKDAMFPLIGFVITLVLSFMYVKSLFLIFIPLFLAAFPPLVNCGHLHRTSGLRSTICFYYNYVCFILYGS